jgi:signal transduction histidine kinase
MRQLFYNLIGNAIKFRKRAVDPVIRIETEKLSGNAEHHSAKKNGGEYYRISISDNGIGFDSKYSDEIFMVFKRLHSYHAFEGSGVGLSICKKIIEKHNGTITAKGNPDQGSTFTIELPTYNEGIDFHT